MKALAGFCVALLVLAACEAASTPGESPPTPWTSHGAVPSFTSSTPPASPTVAPSGEAHLVIVGLGDSTMHPSSCNGCTDFLELYGREIASRTGLQVVVDNRAAIQFSNEPAVEAPRVLRDLEHDAAIRAAVGGADIVVLNVGYNDTPWNRLDDPRGAAPGYPVVDWAKITDECTDRVVDEYATTLDEILAAVSDLRGSRPTALRVVTVYNGTVGNEVDESWDSPTAIEPTVRANDLLAQRQCEIAVTHGGLCADVHHAINGEDGRQAAGDFLLASDYTHLSQRGHDVVARLLTDLGIYPIEP